MQPLPLLEAPVMLDGLSNFCKAQVQTPTSSADEVDLHVRDVIKSPLAKHDQISAARPSESDDTQGQPAVESQMLAAEGAVNQPIALLAALPLPITAPVTAAVDPAGAEHATGPAPWLMGLFSAALFEPAGCRCHPGVVRNGTVKRNENNQYCLGCTHAQGTGMCKLCLPAHSACCTGRVFQIRKYMYQTCVHVDDIQPLYDVSGVQAYCINSRRAVLIHPKNVDKEQKCPAFDHTCVGCHKPLRHDCTYCSLRCKVDFEYGLAPVTPRSAAAAGRACGAPAAVAAAVVLTTQPRQQNVSRLAASKRPTAASAAAAAAFAVSAAAFPLPLLLPTACSLDVSHATHCSSFESGSSRGKRRKTYRPERSHVS